MGHLGPEKVLYTVLQSLDGKKGRFRILCIGGIRTVGTEIPRSIEGGDEIDSRDGEDLEFEGDLEGKTSLGDNSGQMPTG